MSNITFRRVAGRSAFTLLELIVCIAMALVLMLGVNQVFSLTSRTVSTSAAFSDMHRDVRAATSVIAQDAQSAASDGPYFLIRSSTIDNAWRNHDDEASAAVAMDYSNPVVGGVQKSFRDDKLAFFARGIFKRATGQSNAQIVSDMTSAESYVWYGHLKQPGPYTDPAKYYQSFEAPAAGTAANHLKTNPANYYASQWILGRVGMLMSDPTPSKPNDPTNSLWQIKDRTGVGTAGTNQTYIGHDRNPDGTFTTTTMAPFALNSKSTIDGKNFAATPSVEYSRYDLAGVGTATFRDEILKPFLKIKPGKPLPATSANWWNNVSDFYFQGDPQPRKPFNATTVAALAPVFLRGCTDFAVEFAGDFVTQDANPASSDDTAKDLAPDQQIDWAYDTVSKARKVRWYGMTPNKKSPLFSTHKDVTRVSDFSKKTALFEHVQGTDYIAGWDPLTDAKGFARPKMLRITIVLDDVSARIAGGQIFEFVVPMQ